MSVSNYYLERESRYTKLEFIPVKDFFHILPREYQEKVILDKEYYGIKDSIYHKRNEMGVLADNMKSLEDVRSLWMRSPFLSIPEYTKDEKFEAHFIWEFGEYLHRLKISNTDDLFSLYSKLCIFFKKYYTFKKTTILNMKKLCDFLIMDVLRPAVSTCYFIYKTTVDDEGFEVCSSIFKYFMNFIHNYKESQYSHIEIKKIVNDLCMFYKLYKLDYSYLTVDGDGKDLFLSSYIWTSNHISSDEIDEVSKQINQFIFSGDISTGIQMESVYVENLSDPVVRSNDLLGKSESDITVFGDSGMFNGIVTNMASFKSDLLKFNSDYVNRYVGKGENVNINFVIDEQLKMFIKAELNCKMLIANIRKDDEANMITIMNYENDNFVLFTVSDTPDILYGLSINENPINNERKLITIDKDDDISFNFVVNFGDE